MTDSVTTAIERLRLADQMSPRLLSRAFAGLSPSPENVGANLKPSQARRQTLSAWLPMITILGANSLRTAASDQNASAIPLLIGRMMTFGTISNRAAFLTILFMMRGLSVSVASAAPWLPRLSVKNSSSAGQNTARHIFAPLSVVWLAGVLWIKNTRGKGGDALRFLDQ